MGDQVRKGDTLVTLHANREDVSEVQQLVLDSYKLVKEEVAKPTLIYKEIYPV